MDIAGKKTDAHAKASLQEAFDLILKGRGRSDTPGKSLKCIGLFTVILRLRALDERVTRQALARETGLTENAIAPHVRYLESLGLVTMTSARASNSIAREFHIDAEDGLIEYTRKAVAKSRYHALQRTRDKPRTKLGRMTENDSKEVARER